MICRLAVEKQLILSTTTFLIGLARTGLVSRRLLHLDDPDFGTSQVLHWSCKHMRAIGNSFQKAQAQSPRLVNNRLLHRLLVQGSWQSQNRSASLSCFGFSSKGHQSTAAKLVSRKDKEAYELRAALAVVAFPFNLFLLSKPKWSLSGQG